MKGTLRQQCCNCLTLHVYRLAIGDFEADIAIANFSDAADDAHRVRDRDEQRGRHEREARVRVQVEREEGEDRVLARHDEAAPQRQQPDVPVAGGTLGAADGVRLELVAPFERRGGERENGHDRDRARRREAPAPAPE